LLAAFCIVRRPPIAPLFPSRRSSDLAGATMGRMNPQTQPADNIEPLAQNAFRGDLARHVQTLPPAWREALEAPHIQGVLGKLDRSEEHTSELQSRENLVCRLLLEKKN